MRKILKHKINWLTRQKAARYLDGYREFTRAYGAKLFYLKSKKIKSGKLLVESSQPTWDFYSGPIWNYRLFDPRLLTIKYNIIPITPRAWPTILFRFSVYFFLALLAVLSCCLVAFFITTPYSYNDLDLNSLADLVFISHALPQIVEPLLQLEAQYLIPSLTWISSCYTAIWEIPFRDYIMGPFMAGAENFEWEIRNQVLDLPFFTTWVPYQLPLIQFIIASLFAQPLATLAIIILLIIFMLFLQAVAITFGLTLLRKFANSWRLTLALSQPRDWDNFFLTPELLNQQLGLSVEDGSSHAALNDFLYFYKVGFIDNELKYYNTLEKLLVSSKLTVWGYRGFLNLLPTTNVLLDLQLFLQKKIYLIPKDALKPKKGFVFWWRQKRLMWWLKRLNVTRPLMEKYKTSRDVFLTHSFVPERLYSKMKIVNERLLSWAQPFHWLTSFKSRALIGPVRTGITPIIHYIREVRRLSAEQEDDPFDWVQEPDSQGGGWLPESEYFAKYHVKLRELEEMEYMFPLSPLQELIDYLFVGLDYRELLKESLEPSPHFRTPEARASANRKTAARSYARDKKSPKPLASKLLRAEHVFDYLSTAPLLDMRLRKRQFFNFNYRPVQRSFTGDYAFSEKEDNYHGLFDHDYQRHGRDFYALESTMVAELSADDQWDEEENGPEPMHFFNRIDPTTIEDFTIEPDPWMKPDEDEEWEEDDDMVTSMNEMPDTTSLSDFESGFLEYETYYESTLDEYDFQLDDSEQPERAEYFADHLLDLSAPVTDEDRLRFSKLEETFRYDPMHDYLQNYGKLVQTGFFHHFTFRRSASTKDYAGASGLEQGSPLNYQLRAFDTLYDDLADFFWVNSADAGISSRFNFARSRELFDVGNVSGLRSSYGHAIRVKPFFYAFTNVFNRELLLDFPPHFLYAIHAAYTAFFFILPSACLLAMLPVFFWIEPAFFSALFLSSFLGWALFYLIASKYGWVSARQVAAFNNNFYFLVCSTFLLLFFWNMQAKPDSREIIKPVKFYSPARPLSFSPTRYTPHVLCLEHAGYLRYFSAEPFTKSIVLGHFFNKSLPRLAACGSWWVVLTGVEASPTIFDLQLRSIGFRLSELYFAVPPSMSEGVVFCDYETASWLRARNLPLDFSSQLDNCFGSRSRIAYLLANKNMFAKFELNTYRSPLDLKVGMPKAALPENTLSRFFFASLPKPRLDVTVESQPVAIAGGQLADANFSERGAFFRSTLGRRKKTFQLLPRAGEYALNDIGLSEGIRLFLSGNLLDRVYSAQTKARESGVSETLFYSSSFGVLTRARAIDFSSWARLRKKFFDLK